MYLFHDGQVRFMRRRIARVPYRISTGRCAKHYKTWLQSVTQHLVVFLCFYFMRLSYGVSIRYFLWCRVLNVGLKRSRLYTKIRRAPSDNAPFSRIGTVNFVPILCTFGACDVLRVLQSRAVTLHIHAPKHHTRAMFAYKS